MILLINPPVAKPTEPPSGIARLAGALKHHKVNFSVADLNMEGLDFILKNAPTPQDKWSMRAAKNLNNNIKAIRDPSIYSNIDRYKQTVNELNHVVDNFGKSSSVKLSIVNYQDPLLSPARSKDLIYAFENFEKNPYFPFFAQRLKRLMDETKPDIIGFSLCYMSQAITTFAMIGFIRKERPLVRILAGGGLVTSWMRRPGWTSPFAAIIDELIDGEGETRLLKISGVDTAKGSYTPFYKPFSNNAYLSPGNILPYSTSGGCYWNKCTFCPQKAEHHKYTPLSSDMVLNQLNNLMEDVKPDLIHFLDNALSPKILSTIGRTKLNTPWYAFTRVTPQLSDPDFCKRLKQSGCVMLKLGIESGDKNVLTKMDKGTDPQIISRVLKTLKNAGIATYVYLLFGTSSETYETALNTMNFISDHSGEISFLNLAIFNLPISSCEAPSLETRDFYGGDLSLYRDFKHPKGWDRYHVRRFIDKEFKRNRAIAEIIKKDPPLFTSNHAAFFSYNV